MSLTVGVLSDIIAIYTNMYKNSSYFLKRKYDKFGPLVEKFTESNSVNSVNRMENLKTEPNSNKIEEVQRLETENLS